MIRTTPADGARAAATAEAVRRFEREARALLRQAAPTVRSAEPSIDDYAERSATQRQWWQAQDGRQAGDPDKLARALMAIAAEDPPPQRFIAGADVLALAERKIAELQRQMEAHRELSSSLGFA